MIVAAAAAGAAASAARGPLSAYFIDDGWRIIRGVWCARIFVVQVKKKIKQRKKSNQKRRYLGLLLGSALVVTLLWFHGDVEGLKRIQIQQ